MGREVEKVRLGEGWRERERERTRETERGERKRSHQ